MRAGRDPGGAGFCDVGCMRGFGRMMRRCALLRRVSCADVRAAAVVHLRQYRGGRGLVVQALP